MSTRSDFEAHRVEISHDFQNGSFDHLADPRDDYSDLLESMCEAPSDEEGPFADRPVVLQRSFTTYMIGGVPRIKVRTVISNRPR